METRVRDPKTAKLTDLPHRLWVQKPTHGTGPAGIPSKKTRLLEGDSQKFRRAARACEKKRGSPFGGGAVFGFPQKTFQPIVIEELPQMVATRQKTELPQMVAVCDSDRLGSWVRISRKNSKCFLTKNLC
jgi:hypothetical protein